MSVESYPCLDYATLVNQYEDRLVSMERGFQMDYAFLDFWVPDENHNKSLYYLFESAALRSQKGLSVTLSPEIVASVDGEGLVEALKGLGGVSSKKEGANTVVTVAFGEKSGQTGGLDDVPGLSQLHRTYREKLIQQTRKTTNEFKEAKAGFIAVDFAEGQVLARINTRTGIVEEFGHKGIVQNALGRMLDLFTRLSVGAPLQEVAEHGAIRLENHLRDPALPAPVRGIITPETAGTYFAALNKMARELFKKAQSELGLKWTRNTWEAPLRADWTTMDEPQRCEKVSHATEKFLTNREIHNVKVYVVGVKQDTQVYIDLEGMDSEREKRAFCRSFEKFLKLEVEPRLEVYLPTALDKLKRDKRSATLAKREPIVSRAQSQVAERATTI